MTMNMSHDADILTYKYSIRVPLVIHACSDTSNQDPIQKLNKEHSLYISKHKYASSSEKA